MDLPSAKRNHMPDLQSLLTNAAQLPVPIRIELIEAIWDSIPAQELPPISEEWQEEIQRRSAEFDAGGVETIAWEEVRAAAHQRIKRNQG
jgi:putative addiction module component (TIGR02574 family)